MAELVWKGLLDGTFNCRVERTGNYAGRLTCRDESRELTIVDQPVTLSYNAVFGPDAGDVAEWESICAKAKDKLEESEAQ